MNFKPLRPRLRIGPYLQGKKGENKPENPPYIGKIPKKTFFSASLMVSESLAQSLSHSIKCVGIELLGQLKNTYILLFS